MGFLVVAQAMGTNRLAGPPYPWLSAPAQIQSEERRDRGAALLSSRTQDFVLRFGDVPVRFFVADNFKSRSAEPL